jgi:hypothetical protein
MLINCIELNWIIIIIIHYTVHNWTMAAFSVSLSYTQFVWPFDGGSVRQKAPAHMATRKKNKQSRTPCLEWQPKSRPQYFSEWRTIDLKAARQLSSSNVAVSHIYWGFTPSNIRRSLGPCRSSGGQPSASHSDGLFSSPREVMRDLCCTEWHWGRFSRSTSISPATYSFH